MLCKKVAPAAASIPKGCDKAHPQMRRSAVGSCIHVPIFYAEISRFGLMMGGQFALSLRASSCARSVVYYLSLPSSVPPVDPSVPSILLFAGRPFSLRNAVRTLRPTRQLQCRHARRSHYCEMGRAPSRAAVRSMGLCCEGPRLSSEELGRVNPSFPAANRVSP